MRSVVATDRLASQVGVESVDMVFVVVVLSMWRRKSGIRVAKQSILCVGGCVSKWECWWKEEEEEEMANKSFTNSAGEVCCASWCFGSK